MRFFMKYVKYVVLFFVTVSFVEPIESAKTTLVTKNNDGQMRTNILESGKILGTCAAIASLYGSLFIIGHFGLCKNSIYKSTMFGIGMTIPIALACRVGPWP